MNRWNNRHMDSCFYTGSVKRSKEFTDYDRLDFPTGAVGRVGWVGVGWLGWVRLGWVGLGWVKSSWVGSSQVRSGKVGLGWVELVKSG